MRRKFFTITIFLLTFGGVESWFLWKQKQVNKRIEKHLEEAQSKNILFLGNSHMHFGLNPNKIPNALNLAYPSELFLFTYLKIKLLQPKVAVVALNPQHLQKNNEDALRNGLLSESQYRYLYQQLNNKTQATLYQYTPFEQWAFFKTSQYLPFLGNRFKTSNPKELLGGYQSQTSSREVNPDDIELRMQTVFTHYRYALSVLQFAYLKEIVTYANTHHIRLIFLGFPLHPAFFKKISSKAFNSFQQTLEALKRTGNFEYWDYSQEFKNTAYFYDSDHLNKKGSEVFSQIVSQRLAKSKTQ